VYSLVLQPEWDCATCTASQQATRGCEAPPSRPIVFREQELTRCPRRPLLEHTSSYDELFWLYQNYTRGILPYGQALYRNPHKLVQMFQIIDNAKSEARHEQEKRERKRQAMQQQFTAAKTGG
jgi:hypothetical protein